MLERVHVLRAHSCKLRHGALLRAKATGLAAASSLRERQRRLPSKRPDWMTLNFRSCAPVTGIECRVCRTA